MDRQFFILFLFFIRGGYIDNIALIIMILKREKKMFELLRKIDRKKKIKRKVLQPQ